MIKASPDRLCHVLGLESLADRRYYIQTCLNAVSKGAYLSRSTTQNKIKVIPARIRVFENFFFPIFIEEWGKLNDKIRNIESINLK